MQKNYLVLAHKNPDQLYRMITALNDNVSHFFIHIDAKSPIAPFKEHLQGLPVYFIDKRECCFWGDFSIVRATIILYPYEWAGLSYCFSKGDKHFFRTIRWL